MAIMAILAITATMAILAITFRNVGADKLLKAHNPHTTTSTANCTNRCVSSTALVLVTHC